MASNTAPNFTKNGNISSAKVTAANTSSQGGGTIATDIFKAFTAGADGALVQWVRFQATATAAATNTTQTVGRVFISSITSGTTTSADTFLFQEVALPVVSADSTTVASNPIDVPMNLRLPGGWTILITNHSAPAANTAWISTVIGGDY